MESRSAGALTPAMLVDFHEIAERYGKERVLGGRERIDAQLILKARYQHGEPERIEAAIREREILIERRQDFALLPRNLLHLIEYG